MEVRCALGWVSVRWSTGQTASCAFPFMALLIRLDAVYGPRRVAICLPLRLLTAMEKREIATAPPRRPQGRRTPRPPVDGGSVSPTRSTSYLSRSSSWQTFNGLNPRDSRLHKCLQRFSKRLQGVGQYWASTQMLSAAARGNCGKLEKWTAGKSTAWKLPDPAQTPQPSSW